MWDPQSDGRTAPSVLTLGRGSLLVGTGLDIAPFPDALRRWLKEGGIGLDVMQTGAAARTYNILMAENRKVAAALIAVA